jgi:hypothetical protein
MHLVYLPLVVSFLFYVNGLLVLFVQVIEGEDSRSSVLKQQKSPEETLDERISGWSIFLHSFVLFSIVYSSNIDISLVKSQQQ